MYWDDKPFYSLNYYLKNKFGEKVFKIAIDGGFTCPNRDGTLGYGGCIYCSESGSGDFTDDSSLSIKKQLEYGKERLRKKFKGNKFIAYFQAYTNTYDNIENLEKKYMAAIDEDYIVGISIATRPDCIDENIALLLNKINKIKPVWVELGLQTIHDKTAKFIRRGYKLDCFENCLTLLNKYNLDVIVHLILGLPYETHQDIISSIMYINTKKIHGVKLQLLHVLKNTDLASVYYNNEFEVLDRNEYISLIIDCVEILREDIVIHRITGDGPRNLLIAPKWSTDKKSILNQLLLEFDIRNTYQGKNYQ